MSPTIQEGSRFGDSICSDNPLGFGGRKKGLHTALCAVAITVVLILLFLAGSAVAGSKDSAPPAPNRPWAAPGLAEHQADLQNRHLEIASDAEVNPHKVYELPDLIDLAQRLNPETKVSWQRAKEALAAVGLKEVTYYPLLSAAAAAGYVRLFAPLPSLSINRAALVHAIATGGSVGSAISLQDSGNSLHLDILADTTLSLQWLLFDFGERAASVRSAREELLIANVAFNATHQKLVFEVSRNFYAYNTERDAVRVAQSSLETANTPVLHHSTRQDSTTRTSTMCLTRASERQKTHSTERSHSTQRLKLKIGSVGSVFVIFTTFLYCGRSVSRTPFQGISLLHASPGVKSWAVLFSLFRRAETLKC